MGEKIILLIIYLKKRLALNNYKSIKIKDTKLKSFALASCLWFCV